MPRPHRSDAGRQRFAAFGEQPETGDALYVGLDRPAPGMAVALHFDCEIEGVGVDPTDPPLAWEAWDGEEWARLRARTRTRPGA